MSYLDDIFHFNFGTDVSQYPATVSSLLGETIPWTLTLVGSATVIAFAVGTALGIVAGWRHGGALDRVLPGLMFLQAIPYFFFALILVELLAIKGHVFPIGQGYSNGLIPGWHWDFISSAVYHSLLPALTIVLTSIAGWFEYNSQNYTGWPTQDNPYETGQPSGTNNGPGSGTDVVVILHLVPRT